MFASYAQNFEDVILWRALKHIENGFYLDIGAQDPVIDSVSRGFYEKGWRGIHAEATVHYSNLIKLNRPDEVVLQVAVGDGDGTISFFEIAETGLSTGDVQTAMTHRELGRAVRETQVNIVPLSRVFERAGDRDIHWLKIDVEGMETSVIRSWQPSKSRPWVVVVEATEPNSQTPSHEGWEFMLLEYGYVFVYFDGLSRFYVHEDQKQLMAKFGPGPNVFDQFVLRSSSAFVDQRQIADMEAEIADLSSKLSAEVELNKELQNSFSWKITAPLRAAPSNLRYLGTGISAHIGFRQGSRPRRAMQFLLTHAMLWVRNRPRLARVILKGLKLSPTLQRRLISAAQARGMALSFHSTHMPAWHIDIEPEVIEKWEKLRR